MEIADEVNASAGGIVWVPDGTGNLYSPSNSAGTTVYHFTVPVAGEYVIWGRQISNDTASDSFFVSVGGQPDMAWHTKRGDRDIWTWDVVSNRTETDPRDATQPQKYWLAAGSHTLTIKQREDGTKFDSIVITNDLSLGASDFCVKLAADVNGDGFVNFADLATLRSQFVQTGCAYP